MVYSGQISSEASSASGRRDRICKQCSSCTHALPQRRKSAYHLVSALLVVCCLQLIFAGGIMSMTCSTATRLLHLPCQNPYFIINRMCKTRHIIDTLRPCLSVCVHPHHQRKHLVTHILILNLLSHCQSPDVDFYSTFRNAYSLAMRRDSEVPLEVGNGIYLSGRMNVSHLALELGCHKGYNEDDIFMSFVLGICSFQLFSSHSSLFSSPSAPIPHWHQRTFTLRSSEALVLLY